MKDWVGLGWVELDSWLLPGLGRAPVMMLSGLELGVRSWGLCWRDYVR